MSNSVRSVEPAIDPNNRPSFLIDWEVTLKCNLDCDYCPTGLYGGHDNTTKHPDLEQCLQTVRGMFAYVDLYMLTKPASIRYCVLNVYGGESLHHPNIVEILQYIHQQYEQYKSRWHLTVTTTTNAIVTEKKLQSIIPLIDEFTVSYHTNNSDQQKAQFKQNLFLIKNSGKRVKCVVLMHNSPELFEDSQKMIDWCNENSVKYLPKQLDEPLDQTKFDYTESQIVWFKNFYNQRSYQSKIIINDSESLKQQGRGCCGGRQFCQDQDYNARSSYINNKFTDWHCSVNHFFLYIKQVTGEVFVNKDCKMNYSGTVGPIGNIFEFDTLLETTAQQIQNKTLPVIVCAKSNCECGMCAPKAQLPVTYHAIMKKYLVKS